MPPNQPVTLDTKSIQALVREMSRSGVTGGGGPSRGPAPRDYEQKIEGRYKALDKKLEELNDTIGLQNTQLKRQAMKGEISQRQANKSLARQQAYERRLERIKQQELKNGVASLNGMNKIQKAQNKYAKQMQAEADLLKKSGVGRAFHSAAQDMKVAAAEAAQSAKDQAKANARYWRDLAADTAAEKAGQGLGREGFGGAPLAALTRKLSGGGPIAQTLGIGVGIAVEAFQDMARKADIARLRYMNYGAGTQDTGQGQGIIRRSQSNFAAEYKAIQEAEVKAIEIANKTGEETNVIMTAIARVATETGEKFNEGASTAVDALARMQQEGLGSLEDLLERYVKARKSFGQSNQEAIKEMQQISADAREISAVTDNVMRLDDFYKAVEEVRGGIDSLTASSAGLSKMLKLQIALGKKLGLTYDQALDSAKKLTLGLSQNYDQGFATVEVQEDLQALLTDESLKRAAPGTPEAEMYQRVMSISQDLISGRILPDMAAKLVNEIAGTSFQLMAGRLGRATAGEPVAMTEKRLGIPITYGVNELLKKIETEKTAGRDVSSLMKELFEQQQSVIDDEKRAAKTRQEEISRQQESIAGPINEMLKTITQSINKFVSALTDGLNELIHWLNNWTGASMPYLPSTASPPPPPPFAKGGVFTQPTLGTIGEAGPEAVIPLRNTGIGTLEARKAFLRGAMDLPSQARTTASGSIVLTIPASVLAQAINMQRRQAFATDAIG